MIIEISKQQMMIDINYHCCGIFERLTYGGEIELPTGKITLLKNYTTLTGTKSNLVVPSYVIAQSYILYGKAKLCEYMANLLDTDEKLCRVWRIIKDI